MPDKGSVRLCTVIALLVAVSLAGAEGVGEPAVLGFEAPGAWQTAPPLTQEFAEPDLWSSRTIPYKPYYRIWTHKLVLDPVRERLFLAYGSQTSTECLFKDEYLAALFVWPDREMRWLTEPETKAPPLGTYCREPHQYAFYAAPPTEMCIMLSEDHGDTWRLATTDDFR